MQLPGAIYLDRLFGETFTVEERISAFIDELASRDEIWMHFHTSDPKVNVLKDPATWAASELSVANQTCGRSPDSPTVRNGDTMMVTGDLQHANGTLTDIKFTLKQEETNNSKILKLDLAKTITDDNKVFSVK